MGKRKRPDFRTKIILKKVAQGAILSTVILIFVLLFGSETLFGEYLFYETMPYYQMTGAGTAYFKFTSENEEYSLYEDENSFIETFLSEDGQAEIADGVLLEEDIYVESFNPDRIEEDDLDYTIAQNDIVGLNDIVFQDEEEFGAIPDAKYKENFTSADLDRLRDVDYLLSAFYNKDSKTGVDKALFDVDQMLRTDLSLEKSGQPQVLIFHTHASTEFFIDSDTSDIYEGVVGAGAQLKYVLENKYGIQALHHTGVYDQADGVSSRGGSYERMEPTIERILAENPSIQFVVDIHRDGIEPDPELVTFIDGKPYAKIMFVNGLSAMNDGGRVVELDYLQNPNLATNLALSFNMQMAANTYYPDFTRRIYLKTYRFSTHMMPRSLLVEIGSQYNTKEEAFNAMELLADLIDQVVFQ